MQRRQIDRKAQISCDQGRILAHFALSVAERSQRAADECWITVASRLRLRQRSHSSLLLRCSFRLRSFSSSFDHSFSTLALPLSLWCAVAMCSCDCCRSLLVSRSVLCCAPLCALRFDFVAVRRGGDQDMPVALCGSLCTRVAVAAGLTVDAQRSRDRVRAGELSGRKQRWRGVVDSSSGCRISGHSIPPIIQL